MIVDWHTNLSRPKESEHAIDYAEKISSEDKVTDRLILGSDFPLRSPEEPIEEFLQPNDWGPDVKMPPFPVVKIVDAIDDRRLSLVWKNGAEG